MESDGALMSRPERASMSQAPEQLRAPEEAKDERQGRVGPNRGIGEAHSRRATREVRRGFRRRVGLAEQEVLVQAHRLPDSGEEVWRPFGAGQASGGGAGQ